MIVMRISECVGILLLCDKAEFVVRTRYERERGVQVCVLEGNGMVSVIRSQTMMPIWKALPSPF